MIHEHVTAGNDVNVLVDEVRASGQEGVSCLVDAATGRRQPVALDNLRTIATRSGVHIVVAGGYFKAPYPPQVAPKGEDEVATIHEILVGNPRRFLAFVPKKGS